MTHNNAMWPHQVDVIENWHTSQIQKHGSYDDLEILILGIENVEENYSGWQGYPSQFKSISDDDDIILLKCRWKGNFNL